MTSFTTTRASCLPRDRPSGRTISRLGPSDDGSAARLVGLVVQDPVALAHFGDERVAPLLAARAVELRSKQVLPEHVALGDLHPIPLAGVTVPPRVEGQMGILLHGTDTSRDLAVAQSARAVIELSSGRLSRMKQVFYGVSGTSIAVHAPSPDDSSVAACDQRILLKLADPWDLELALEADIVCRRRACRDQLGQAETVSV